MEKNSLSRPPLGLGGTYDVHLRLIGKLVGDFLLVIIELFSLGAFVLSQYTRLTHRQTDTVYGEIESRQQYRACFRFVTIHAFDRRMDRQTESQGIPCICFAVAR